MHRNEQGSGVDSGALIARLLECHSRIREMLTMASGIVAVGSADEARAVAERLGRYFTRGLPLHTRDEEESILPRLAAGPDLSIALDRMQREHVQHETWCRSSSHRVGISSRAPHDGKSCVRR